VQEGHVFKIDLVVLKVSDCEVITFGQHFDALGKLLLSETDYTDFVESVAISDAQQ